MVEAFSVASEAGLMTQALEMELSMAAVVLEVHPVLNLAASCSKAG